MKPEEIVEFDALRAELETYYRETRTTELECARLFCGPATPETQARAKQITREATAREKRYERILDMALKLIERPFADEKRNTEALPS